MVDILAEGHAFEVEFCDREGRTYESVGLHPDQLVVLRFEPALLPPEPVMEMGISQGNSQAFFRHQGLAPTKRVLRRR